MTPEDLATKAAPYVTPVVAWIAGTVGTLGTFLLHLLLTLLLCAVFYVTGETAASGVRRFSRRLQGEAGDRLVLLAAGSIRAVALGIVVTAIVQTALGALGLVVAGAPYVAIFAALMFVLCIAQLGPVLPMLAAVGWLYVAGATTAAIGLFVWTLIVGSLDNVLRPMLIRRGADLPLLLIMAGVIGGLLSFGLVGLFVGPVVLAIAWTQLSAWVAEQGEAPDALEATPTGTEWAVPAGVGPPHRYSVRRHRSPVTFGRRCIPGRGARLRPGSKATGLRRGLAVACRRRIARRLHTPGMRPPRALRAGRIAALGVNRTSVTRH